MKPPTRVRAAALLSGAFLVLLSVVAQPAASAAPAAAADNPSCWSAFLNPNGAVAQCNGAMAYGEKVRAVVKCDGFWSDYYRRGPWRHRPLQRSQIYCDQSSHDALQHYFEVVIAT